jgi:hypothetical protein
VLPGGQVPSCPNYLLPAQESYDSALTPSAVEVHASGGVRLRAKPEIRIYAGEKRALIAIGVPDPVAHARWSDARPRSAPTDAIEPAGAVRGARSSNRVEPCVSRGRHAPPETDRIKGVRTTGGINPAARYDEANVDNAAMTPRRLGHHTPVAVEPCRGRGMMQMLGSFAEFERSMIRERTRAGLAAAKEDGRVGGRPRSLDDKQCREIADAVLSGRKSAADMARLFGVSPATVSRAVAGRL